MPIRDARKTLFFRIARPDPSATNEDLTASTMTLRKIDKIVMSDPDDDPDDLHLLHFNKAISEVYGR